MPPQTHPCYFYSLDDFIEARLGRPHNQSAQSGNAIPTELDEAFRTRSERIRAFRAARAQPPDERERRRAERARGIRTAVHLLSAEEVKTLFTDVSSGLGFLVCAIAKSANDTKSS